MTRSGWNRHAAAARARLAVVTSVTAVVVVVVAAGCALVDPAASGRPPRTPVASPTGVPSPSFIRPTATPYPTFLAYTVRSGDTLTSIARQFQTTPRSLALWNRDRYASLDPDSPAYAPNAIKVGWQFRLVPGIAVDPEDDLPSFEPEPSGAG